MFKNLTALAQMLRSASSLGQRVDEMKTKLAAQMASGSSSEGQVQVEVSGLGQVQHIRIAPELLAKQDGTLLEQLILSAMNEALTKVRKMHVEMMREATGGIDLPGLQDALANL